MRTHTLAAMLIALGLAGNGPAMAGAPPRPPSFRGLGTLCGTQFGSAGSGVSDDGRIVVGQSAGDLEFDPATLFPSRAFRWQHGLLLDLGELPGGIENAAAFSISDDGSVIVGESTSGDSDPKASGAIQAVEAFRWTAGTGIEPLGDLPGGAYLSFALAVSADGSVIGGGSESGNGYEAFRYQSGVMTALGDLPGGGFYSYVSRLSDDGAVAVGLGSSAAGYEAFRWTAGSGMIGLGLLAGAPSGSFGSGAFGTSDNGSVAVGASSSGNSGLAELEAFRWTAPSGMIGLGDLPGGVFSSLAEAVSGDGAIVVGAGTTDNLAWPPLPGVEAFIWDAPHGMRNLQEVLTSELGLGADVEGWTLLDASDISSDGRTIVGFGVNPNGDIEGYIAYLGEAFGQATCPGDVNGDGQVNVQDLVALITSWGMCP